MKEAVDLRKMDTEVLKKLAQLNHEPALAEMKRRESDPIALLAKNDPTFAKVMAGQISPQDFFTKPEYEATKQKFIQQFNNHCPELAGSKFGQDNLASAWLTKLRYNENMSNEQFTKHIQRGEQIFFVKPDEPLSLDLTNPNPDKNDNISMQWGIEALTGIQTFDSGVARVRFPEGVGPKIYQAFQAAGAPHRSSTHAHATRLEDGLGKDVVNESDRQFTPRGAGHTLMLATSKNGDNKGLQPGGDFDLVLKREDYGFKDKASHTIRHSVGGLKKVVGYNPLIDKKSSLAKQCEEEHGKGHKIHRKEHLSELKGQSKNLINLLEAGKKEGLFQEFKTKWCIRIAIPPWEKKIFSESADQRQGIGKFLRELAVHQDTLQKTNPEDIAAVQGLINQAKKGSDFTDSREGNEVMVDCSQQDNPQLLSGIAKESDNAPVDRHMLEQEGIVTSDYDAVKDDLTAEEQEIYSQMLDEDPELDQEQGASATVP
ncbi:hypothetical protein [Legionella shakespearei]|uniref:Uncharacterized protein n=1 Tax=Legionella shakespearei DSM 23087 TaxID=1122169 RepID=A0A0W0Z2I6_9GAMM|nr:hypothetical protein [Legionella shakespearei]KTD63338.1 hypothetical protein Lsha_0758 [Legionella shakespearei DSM 23087]